MSLPEAIGLDLGGTKLLTGVVDAELNVHHESRERTTGASETEVVDTIVEEIEEAKAARPGAVAVGLGIPCTMDRERGVAINAVNLDITDVPIRDIVAERTGLPVFVDNDAKALALGEGWLGAAQGETDYIAMVVSTGVGGGIVLDGRLLDGAAGNAGHIGHVVVVPDGRPCVCGSRGCLEAEVSGTAIAARTGAPAADAPREERERAGRLVGLAVGSTAALLDLRLALVAGSVALGYGDDFFAAAQAELDRTARIEFALGATIRPAALGADGPLVGAAAVAWRALGRPVLAAPA